MRGSFSDDSTHFRGPFWGAGGSNFVNPCFQNWLYQLHQIWGVQRRFKMHFAFQGHSRSPTSVPIDSSYATSYKWLILTDILFRTVSKLSPITRVFRFWTKRTWAQVSFVLSQRTCLTDEFTDGQKGLRKSQYRALYYMQSHVNNII